jgi:hypothetical protein
MRLTQIRLGHPFAMNSTVRILNHTMKNIRLLLSSIVLFGLIGISCETPANPDVQYRVENTDLSGLSPTGAQNVGAGSAEDPKSGGASSAAMHSTVPRPAAGQPRETDPTRERQEGELEMAALARAYPERIGDLAFRNDDWAVRIDDTWYCWAHGRLLPEELRDQWEQYTSYRFYSYPLDLPPIPNPDEETKRRLKERLEQAEKNPPSRHEGLLADLYRAATRGQTEARIVTVKLMGFEVRVHEQIAEPLEAVNRDLEILVETDPGVQRFVAGLKGLAGYNWREIAGTRSRSYHSYGIAVDLAPKSFGGRHTYWRWALPQNEEFYTIPYEQRWMVPQQIVKIFEEQGFVWGGKWFYFDTMHFEYRPEILVLAAAAGEQQ